MFFLIIVLTALGLPGILFLSLDERLSFGFLCTFRSFFTNFSWILLVNFLVKKMFHLSVKNVQVFSLSFGYHHWFCFNVSQNAENLGTL